MEAAGLSTYPSERRLRLEAGDRRSHTLPPFRSWIEEIGGLSWLSRRSDRCDLSPKGWRIAESAAVLGRWRPSAPALLRPDPGNFATSSASSRSSTVGNPIFGPNHLIANAFKT
jgi:hypothetical protein